MMDHRFTESELEAYLDEELTPADMAVIERALRSDDALTEQLHVILQRRDSGVHSLAEIWRTNRLSCPDREELGNYLLGVLDDEQAAFVRGHLEEYGCRFCLANWEDLRTRKEEAAATVTRRLKRYFETSARLLRRDEQ